MPSKVFPLFKEDFIKDSYSLRSSSFYAYLVEAEPANNASMLSDCTLCSGGNYQYISLNDVGNSYMNRIVSNGSGGFKVVFQNPTWVNLTTGTNAPIPGVVISTGTSTSSRIACYLERVVNGTPTPFTPSGIPFSFDFQTQGIMVLN